MSTDTDSDIGKWLKQAFGLHFIDPADVEDCFVEDFAAKAPQDERCTKFSDYLVEHYVTSESKYPPVIWADVPSNSKRTNNAAVSFHAHFNAQFYASHPTIFVFVLQKIQSTTYVKIRSSAHSAPTLKNDRD